MSSIWPPRLIEDLARRRTIIVIGSGVSRHAVAADGVTRPPVWKEFLESAISKYERNERTEHIYKAIESGDLLHACEWIKNKYDEDWAAFLRSKFITPRYSSGKLHELIALIDTRVVFSLNFDDIYETKSREINDTSQFVKHYYDTDIVEFLRGDSRYIVKVHGSLSSTSNLIFTQKEYAQARSKYSLFYNAFDAALMSHSFLFIGCGYSDPDINILLENQCFSTVQGSNNPHYFLTGEGINNDLKNSLRNNRNLKTITYDPKDAQHSGLVDVISELYDKVGTKREELIETRNW
ncbi:SIR2 family NAD-dependent protein deacylase [Aeromonas dhakensis]|uniref:SIR2 family NAD-dependent protein deacylase n=1 Tax=Aeromonas dhakensis TaxID=196024 RepID=UPI0038B4C8BE